MATFTNETFRDETIALDGNTYQVCSFTNCRLTYSGGDLPSFVNCDFNGVSINLENGAFQTLRYLTGLYHGGLSGPVDSTLDRIAGYNRLIVTPADQYKAKATGTNYLELFTYAGVLLLITFGLVFAIIYGFMIYPQNEVLDNDRPLSEEIPVQAMPILPEALGEQYDALRQQQLDRLDAYSWTNEENNIATIPLDQASAIIVQQGPPTWELGETE